MSIQYVTVRVDTTGLFQPVSMAQGVVGVAGPAEPATGFEQRHTELFTRPLVGARGEPYKPVVRVMRINDNKEPLDAKGNPLGRKADGTFEQSLGVDANNNPVPVDGLKIDANGGFVGDDGTTKVELDPATKRPKKFDRTLYQLHFAWFPTPQQEPAPLHGAPVDGNRRIIRDLLMDSDGKFTDFAGTDSEIDPATGYPKRQTGELITNLDFGLSELARSINLALTNGAIRVEAFRTNRDGSAPQLTGGAGAFADFESKQINIVCLSKTTDPDSIDDLREHVENASPNDAGGGGTRPRIGVAMLPKEGWTNGAGEPSQELSDFGIDWTSSRMVLVAHKSDDDVAAAVAGTIARYDPWISLVMKEVAGIRQTEKFTDKELAVWVDPEAQGIVQARVNPIIDPEFLAGAGLVMGEGYTADGTGQRLYIDIVRTIDDLAFRLKAHLTNPNVIGTMRINRPGLTGLRTLVSALLDSRAALGEIDSYTIDIPLFAILQKDPAQRTPEETQQINNVQNSRRLEFSVSVDYAGAIHYLAVTLKFV